MNGTEIIELVAKRTDFHPTVVEEIIGSYFETLEQCLRVDGSVTIRNFGRFRVWPRQGRDAVSPLTHKPMVIPDYWAISFTAGKALKRRLNAVNAL